MFKKIENKKKSHSRRKDPGKNVSLKELTHTKNQEHWSQATICGKIGPKCLIVGL